jgi:hypothetical protein
MGFVELKMPIGSVMREVSIQSLEPAEWHRKWSGLIECTEGDSEVHGGIYVYIPDVTLNQDDIFNLPIEQLKVDIVVQGVSEFFKVHMSVSDLKTNKVVSTNFITTAKSIMKYSGFVQSTKSTWIFIRTDAYMFHGKVDIDGSHLYQTYVSKLQ